MSTTISREELRAAMDAESVTVVDALPPAAYANRHLPGALNVVAEHTDEQVRAALHDTDATIVTYSTDERCSRGPELTARLRRLSYREVLTYEGGIEDWIAAGLPIDRADTAADDSAARGTHTDGEPSPTLAPVRLIPLPDGPYQVTGPLEIRRADGAPIPAPKTVYLCRCGRSANKPFCDGSHARTGWTEHP